MTEFEEKKLEELKKACYKKLESLEKYIEEEEKRRLEEERIKKIVEEDEQEEAKLIFAILLPAICLLACILFGIFI